MSRLITLILCVLSSTLFAAAKATPPPSNKEVIQQFYKAITEQKYKTIESLMGPDYQLIDIGALYDDNDRRTTEARGDIVKRTRILHKALPGFTVKIEQMISEGDKIIVRTKLMGEQKGAFLGIAPTDKTIVLRNFVEFTIENGKIIRAVELWNELGVMRQMGYIVLN